MGRRRKAEIFHDISILTIAPSPTSTLQSHAEPDLQSTFSFPGLLFGLPPWTIGYLISSAILTVAPATFMLDNSRHDTLYPLIAKRIAKTEEFLFLFILLPQALYHPSIKKQLFIQFMFMFISLQKSWRALIKYYTIITHIFHPYSYTFTPVCFSSVHSTAYCIQVRRTYTDGRAITFLEEEKGSIVKGSVSKRLASHVLYWFEL